MERFTHVRDTSCGCMITNLHILKKGGVRQLIILKKASQECMPEQYRRPSITDSYRLYYMMDKMSFARYKILESNK